MYTHAYKYPCTPRTPRTHGCAHVCRPCFTSMWTTTTSLMCQQWAMHDIFGISQVACTCNCVSMYGHTCAHACVHAGNCWCGRRDINAGVLVRCSGSVTCGPQCWNDEPVVGAIHARTRSHACVRAHAHTRACKSIYMTACDTHTCIHAHAQVTVFGLDFGQAMHSTTVCTLACTNARMCARSRTSACTSAHAHTRMHARIHVRHADMHTIVARICAHVRTRARAYARMCGMLCAHTHAVMHVCTHARACRRDCR